MIKISYSIFILFIIFNVNSGLEYVNRNEISNVFCFHFSWLSEFSTENINCSDKKYKNTPCIEPFLNISTLPNFTEIWLNEKMKMKNVKNNEERRSNYLCPLTSSNSCIKYTVTYNGALLNSSYFCGKMIEDEVSAISNGCFSQMVDGRIIEACACRSGFQMPCNLSTKVTYSLPGITLLLFFVFLIII